LWAKLPTLCNALLANALSQNGLTANGLSFNALTQNSLTYNAITLNALNAYFALYPNSTVQSPNGIGSSGMGIQGHNDLFIGIALVNGTLVFSNEQNATEVSQFFQYLVKCALAPGQTWELSLNGTNYTFEGSIGLTPLLNERRLNPSEDRWLSSCLYAHVNHFGIHVLISVRSADVIAVTQEELQEYRVYEGAFFGDLSNSTMYSCQGETEAQALSESSSRPLRVCTDSTSPCGISSVGRCTDVCNSYSGDLGYQDCAADGTTYHEVVNVYLKNDIVSSAASSNSLWILPLAFLVFSWL